MTDGAGNQIITSASTFTYDTTAPTVTISTPIAGDFYSLVQISTPFTGTASDPGTDPAGVSTVTVSITDVDGGGSNYFTGSTYTGGGPFFLAAQGTVSNWTFNNAALSFINDHRYDVTAKATDAAGNSTTVTHRFVYDVIKPTSTITLPSGSYFTALPNVNGSATDNPGGSTYNNAAGISTFGVQLAVRKVGGSWWNSGSSQFNGSDPDYSYFTVVNTTTTAINPWTVAVPGGFQSALVTGNSYRFITRAIDNADNVEFGPLTTDVPAGIGQTVLYDSASAVSNINFPANNGFYTNVSSITGNADDTLSGSGVSEVDIALIDPNFHYWNGSSWVLSQDCSVSCTPWQPTTFVGNSSGTFSYASLSGNRAHRTPNTAYMCGRSTAPAIPLPIPTLRSEEISSP